MEARAEARYIKMSPQKPDFDTDVPDPEDLVEV